MRVYSCMQIGQQFSTRVDVLSQEFVKELEVLQVCCVCLCVPAPGCLVVH